MGLSFDSVATAARVRDVIKKQVSQSVTTEIAQPSVGRVVDVDLAALTCMVWFVGDAQPIQVNLFTSCIPGAWARRNETPSDVSTAVAGFGSMVVVQRLNDKLYVIDVLTGGQFMYDAEAVGIKLTQQVPYNLNENIAGAPYETFAGVSLDVNASDIPINRGEALVFGPFMPDTLGDPQGGQIEMSVRLESHGVQYYRFPVDATDVFTNNGVTDSRWQRVLPEQLQGDNAGILYDFDLDVCIRKTEYGKHSTFTPWELWFRIVKMTDDFSGMKTNITWRSGIAQRVRSVDNRFILEIDRSPKHIVGYTGYHKSSTHATDYEATGLIFDGYGNRTTLTPAESSNKPYSITTGSQWTVSNGRLRNSQTGTYVSHYARVDYSTAWGINQEGTVDMTLGSTPTNNQYRGGVMLGWISANTYFFGGIRVGTDSKLIPFVQMNKAGTLSTTEDTVTNNGTLGTTTQYRIKVAAERSGAGPTWTVRVKFWNPATANEPDAWMVSQAFVQSANPTVSSGGAMIANSDTVGVPSWTFDNLTVRTTDKQTGITPTVFPWRTGPWRSGLLRAGADLQRTMVLDGQWAFSAIGELSWTGAIRFGGIGANRNLLNDGRAILTQPPTGVPIQILPGGTIFSNSTGIPLIPGDTLYCGIPPATKLSDNLTYELFIVRGDFSFDNNYHLPEWAVMIAHRPKDGTALWKMGDGQVLNRHPYLPDVLAEDGIKGLYSDANSFSNLGGYVNNAGANPAPSVTFTKRWADTRLRIDWGSTYYTNNAAVGPVFGVQLNNVDYDICLVAAGGPANVRLHTSGFLYLPTNTVGAGSWTVRSRIVLTGSGAPPNIVTRDTSDWYSLSVRELW